jgi:uncharacterized repeat protein (TIGR01451 family)
MVLWTVTAGIGLPSARAAVVSNSATGTINGGSLDLTNATVNLNALSGSPAVTSTAVEISPNAVLIGSTGNVFTYDLLPTINGGDTGVDQIAITAPAGYANLAVTAVSVGGTGQALNCPTPGAGQYCAGIAGQVMTITLGTKVTTSLTNIRISFTADAPGSTGSANFTSTVDDTATGAVSAQVTAAGNADGDAADANSITVQVEENAVASVLAEIAPNNIAVGSVGNAFTYDLLPTINAGNTGVNRIAITAPAGYANLTVTAVSVGGAGQVLNCPTPGAGQYCASTAGQTMTITLGTKVTVSLTNIRVSFTTDAPGSTGSANFTSTVDDTATTAATPQASAAGNADGDGTDANSLAVQVEGNAVTSAVAEIAPNAVLISSAGNAFTYDLLPTINAGDTGINRLAITAPAGYANLAVTAVSVGGAGQGVNCPTPGAGQYCASIAGQTITVTLGTKVTVSLTNIRVNFTADAPGAPGSANFTSTVDDTATGAVAAQAASAGNADGDGADANSVTVQVEGNAVSSALAEIAPNAVQISSLGNAFTYDLLPAINAVDTGVNRIAITAPAGYANLTVTAVSVGGTGQALNCPTPGAGQYCAGIAGQVMTITLGTKVTTSLTNIRVNFTADAPGSSGSANFTSTVDDAATGLVAAQATAAGNADGDAADANSIAVQVDGNAVTSVLAEISPNSIVVSSVGNAFVYDLLPTINAGDTGVDRIAVTAPAGYANLTVTALSVGGVGQALNCPAPGAGQYCAGVAGQTITVTLGAKVVASLTNIRINFTADAPGSGGSGNFTSTVDDAATAGAPPQATAAGNADGDGTDANSLAVQVQGNAVTSAAAEIAPNAVLVSSAGNAFTYDLLPTINAGDTGVDQITITAPAGYANLTVTGVSVGGTGQALNCPTPAAGQYCVGIAGQVMTITLGTNVTTSLTNIRVNFTADAPGVSGSASFTSTVDDTATGAVAAQATAAGNADGDGSDANSMTVQVEDVAVASALAEISPNLVGAGSLGNVFVYDLLPTINAGNTGVNQVAITAPAGYGNLAVTSVSVGGVGQGLNCPTPGAGQYCASVAGQTMTVTLGTKVVVSLTNIRVNFTADAPGAPGSANFTSTVDDTATAGALPQATVAGNADGDGTDANSLAVQVEGNAVTSVAAEIAPNAVAIASVGNVFTYDLLPTINAGNTGVDQIAIAAPAGYANLTVTGVSVGGAGQALNCPAPGAGQYCAGIAGQVMTITLGTKVTTSLTNIKINFTADAPASVGSANFTSTVDDTATLSALPQAAVAGNADGNGGNANTLTVSVGDRAVTSVVAEIAPNTVAINSAAAGFIYDLLPTINLGDTGVNQIAITAPAGYTALTVTGVSVGGGPLAVNCPAPGAGEYCAGVAGQVMTITLGTKMTTSLTNLRVNFTVNAPAVTGTADFTATVDDTVTPTVAPQGAVAGNADGDGNDANSITVEVKSVDAGQSLLTADPLLVQVDFDGDGNPFSTITVTPRDGAGNNLGAGLAVSVGATDGVSPFGTLTPVADNGDGTYTARLSATLSGLATVTATVNGVTLNTRPQVAFTVGMVLKITKSANKESAVVGDVITYQIEVKNTIPQSVRFIKMNDQIPRHFKYVKGTTLINGQKAADPTGNRTLIFDLGTIAGLADTNGNGVADAGEAGHLLLSYQLIIGAGASPGDYLNQAQAFDFAPVSNEAEEKVKVAFDPIFDLGTIIGKVFFDENKNGGQDLNEAGIAGVMVALDDGTYVITDDNGLFHFPGVAPGERLIKINKSTLPPGTTITTDEARIISVTRGLMSKVNFGAIYDRESQNIGSPGKRGVAVVPNLERDPVQVIGHIEGMQLFVNGTPVDLPLSEVRLGVEDLQEIVEMKGGVLKEPITFSPTVEKGEAVASWRLTIFDPKGRLFKELHGSGSPPATVKWNGKGTAGKLLDGGEIYQYQLQVSYRDGTIDTSSRRLFGVNKTSAISLNLMGSAFELGSATLNEKTIEILHQLAETLKKYPNEKITIEGYTDNVGNDEVNLALSKKRAEAAMAYLVEKEGIAADRFVLKGLGKAKPIASNLLEEGREMNRRVEIKGEVKEVERAKILNQLRSEPKVVINGQKVKVDPSGRFATQIIQEIDQLNLEIANRQGKVTETTLILPNVEIVQPTGEVELAFGEQNENYRVVKGPKGTVDPMAQKTNRPPEEEVASYRLVGKTEPGNRVWIDNKEIPVSKEGIFESFVPLRKGENIFGIIVTNRQQVSRTMNARLVLSDRDQKGKWVMAVKPVPQLSVLLPPKGVVLSHQQLPVRGMTAPGNQVKVNGKEVQVEKNGTFSTSADLPNGKSTLVIEVADSEGYTGRLEREVEVQSTSFFLMALADGEFGRITTTGNLEEAGAKKSAEFYEKGRLAYYLKGTIQGKYLVTSAFDTGKQGFNRMFRDLDQKETDRFFTNIDPDKFYPVYGDSSTLVYDAQSQGKFYLAVDGEDLHFLIGNFQTGMNDTELAAYTRTLYGARFEYRSVSRTAYGDPDTRLILFASEVRQAHVQNTFRATGGSLYYLSARNVIEGSERVRIEVRDKDTGLVLAQIDQFRDADYTIKYEEGRLLFRQPISSVVDSSALIHQPLLHGHPVFVLVDFEHEVGSFEKKGVGGRVRQQIGDHVAIGGTYVKDGEATADYELKAADVQLRLGTGTEIIGEMAQSEGKDTSNLISEDGGLSFNEIASSETGEGKAYKVAGRFDLSEWFWEKNRLVAEGYYKRLSPEFFSNGTLLEQGTLKYGGGLRVQLTQYDTLQLKYDLQELIPNGSILGGNIVSSAQVGANRVTLQEAEWTHLQGALLLGAAFQNKEIDQGAAIERQETVAARLGWRFTDRLSTTLDHQWAIQGESDRQTTLRVRYGWSETVAAVVQGTHGERGDAALVGATARLGARSQIYVNEKLTKQQGQAPLWGTVVGGDRMLTDQLRVYSEYELQSGLTEQSRALWGLDQRWRLSERFQIDLHYERSHLRGNGTDTTRDAASFGLRYDDPAGSRLAHRFEIRWEEGAVKRVQRLTTHYAELKLLGGWTLFGKFNYSDTRNESLDQLEARFTEAGVGVAYRPIFFDRLNLLAKYTRLDEKRPDPLGVSLETTADVASIEWIFDVTQRIQWVEKYAVKIKEETQAPRPSLTSQTVLSIHRLNYHLTATWDIGLEYRILKQFQADDQMEGFLVEIDREIARHLRFGVGFNFSRFTDNEFSDNNYDARGWFIRAQGKF